MSQAHDLPIPAGLTESAWTSIAKRQGTRWAIEERDASGEVVGIAFRNAQGMKSGKPGGRRGLILPWPLDPNAGRSQDDPVFICEGASDTGALLGLSMDAVGVPMANESDTCLDWLVELLNGLHVVVVGDADSAGRAGAQRRAAALVPSCASVRVIEPPAGGKDCRAAVLAGADRRAFDDLVQSAEPIKIAAPALANGDPVIEFLKDVQAKPVDWLWPDRIALGKITLIVGDPGLGKSLLTLYMAAQVSRGDSWTDAPWGSQPAGGVVLLNTEDDLADTIRPRLDAAGADVDRIIALKAVRDRGQNGTVADRLFDLGRDLPALERAILAVGSCRLVIVDPISAYLGDANSHNNAEIRAVLAPLGDLAARHQVAMVVVSHMNKSASGPAIYRTMGSLAFTAAARAAWAVVKDREDQQRRLLLPLKNNLAVDTGGLAYRIEEPSEGGSPVVVWEPDRVDVSADDMLGGSASDAGGVLDEATDWLKDVLSDGPVPAVEVKAAAKRDGIASRTLDRAKRELGVDSTREGYASKGRWVWAMPPLAHSAPSSTPLGLASYGDVGALCDSGAVNGVRGVSEEGPNAIVR